MTAFTLFVRLVGSTATIVFIAWVCLMGTAGITPSADPTTERARTLARGVTGIGVPWDYADEKKLEHAADAKDGETDADRAWRNEARRREAQLSARPGQATGSAKPMMDLSKYN